MLNNISNKNIKIILIVIFIVSSQLLYSDNIVWSSVNPAFGGNPINGSWLLNSAQSQKQTEATGRTSSSDPSKYFQDSLNRQILSKIAQKIISSIYGDGEESLEPGIIEYGNYIIEIYESGENMIVSLTDILTGAQTIIEVPNY